jgi:Protein of unknown function (DUF1569)
MKNLFDEAVYEEITGRLNKLTAASQRQWGKMEVAQMLAHCKKAFKVPLSEKSPPKMYPFALIGWMMKGKLYNDIPWSKGLPTAPSFRITDPRNFEKEKAALSEIISRFHHSDPAAIAKIVHPIFGKFTGAQWGMAMYKHIDHHLVQFGV